MVASTLDLKPPPMPGSITLPPKANDSFESVGLLFNFIGKRCLITIHDFFISPKGYKCNSVIGTISRSNNLFMIGNMAIKDEDIMYLIQTNKAITTSIPVYNNYNPIFEADEEDRNSNI